MGIFPLSQVSSLRADRHQRRKVMKMATEKASTNTKYTIYKGGAVFTTVDAAKMAVDGMGTRLLDADGDVVFMSPGSEYTIVKGTPAASK